MEINDLNLLRDELDNVGDAIRAADSVYDDREWVFASPGQIMAVNGMLNAAAGSLPKLVRILTLAKLCKYNPAHFRSSRSLSSSGASRLLRWGYGKENIRFGVDTLDDLAKETVRYVVRVSRDEVHKYKRKVKHDLLMETPKPIDPISGNPAWVVHEILDWPGPGDKEGRGHKRFSPAKKQQWDDIAAAYFVTELCILLDNDINVEVANSLKVQLLQTKMADPLYGPDRVIAALKNLASKLNAPEAWMPATIEFNGQTYYILQQ